MGAKWQTTDLAAAYWGSTALTGMYLGTELIWPPPAVSFDASTLGGSMSVASTTASNSANHAGGSNTAMGALVFVTSVNAQADGTPTAISCTYGGVSMSYLGHITQNNADAAHLDCFALGGQYADVPTGTQSVAFSVTFGGSRNYQGRWVCMTFNDVGSFGTLQTKTGTEAGTTMNIDIPSTTTRGMGAFMLAHRSTTTVSCTTGTNRRQPALATYSGDAVVGTIAGSGSTVTPASNRASGVDYGCMGIAVLAA